MKSKVPTVVVARILGKARILSDMVFRQESEQTELIRDKEEMIWTPNV